MKPISVWRRPGRHGRVPLGGQVYPALDHHQNGVCASQLRVHDTHMHPRRNRVQERQHTGTEFIDLWNLLVLIEVKISHTNLIGVLHSMHND